MNIEELDVFKYIKFEEKKHEYYKEDGSKFKMSGTGFVHNFIKNPFDEYNIAAIQAKKHNTTITDVLKLWDYLRHRGTECHRYCELISLGLDNLEAEQIKEKYPDMIKKCDEYLSRFKKGKSKIVKPELIIGDKDLDIAGMVDAPVINKDGKFIITDYKFTKKINTTSYNNIKMKYPFNRIPDSNFGHYSLQLSLYKYIIEKNTNIKVDSLYLIHITKDNTTAYKCEDVSNRIEEAIKELEN